ncbi:MAG TPA: PAS domain S-box protein [Anaerolineae bacterium]|nr:PAS domain S-box protein [Anaerolineae bacterium]
MIAIAFGGFLLALIYLPRIKIALSDSKERYRRLVELSPDGIAVHSNGKIVYINAAGAKMLGADTPEELTSRSLLSFIYLDRHPSVKEQNGQLQGEAMGLIEERLIRSDGQEIDVEIAAAPITYDGKSETQIIMRDITERKQTEEALWEVNEILQALIQSSPLAIITLDLDRNVRSWNQAAEHIFGWSEQEVLGKPNPIVPEDKQGEFGVMQKRLELGEALTNLEISPQKKDGSLIDVSISTALMRDIAGKATGVIGIFADITERKRDKEKLREQKEFSENLLQNSTVAGFVIDSQHNVILWNKACEELTGVNASDVIGTGNQWKAFYDSKQPCLSDIVADGNYEDLPSIYSNHRQSSLIPDGLYAERWCSNLGGKSRYIIFEAAPLYNSKGELIAVIETLQDITERKQAEEALEQERNFTAAVLDTAGALVVVLDREGRIVRFNRACEETTGYSFEEVRGRYVFDIFLLPEEAEAVRSVFSKLKAGQLPSQYENYWLTKDGQRRLISWTNTVLFGADGEVQWIVPTGVDITERKQAEEQIRKLSRGIEQSPSMFMITDANGDIEYVNPKFTQVTGYALGEAIGKNPRILKSGETPPEEYERLWEAITSGAEWRGEFCNKKKNGELYWESASISPIKNPEGEITHFLAVKEDITERKLAEEVLSESEERYRSIINGAAEGFWMIDPQLKTVEVNGSLCEMLGYTREEMLGKTPLSFVDEENKRIFKEQMARIPETAHRHYDIVLKSKDGNNVYTTFNATTIRDASGNPANAFAFVTNITERKLAEGALLEAKERMEQLHRVTPSAIFTVDKDCVITSFNDKATEVTGYTASEIIGRKCTVFALDPCIGKCRLFANGSAEPIIANECTIKRKDGEVRTISKNADLVRDINGSVTGGVESFEDITERKQAEEMIRYMAYYDPLTDLPNRVLLNDRLTLALANAHRNNRMLALLFLDLDSFKTINDTLGHTVGDQLLQDVAGRLRKCLREGDTIARLGGDEFTLLLPQIDHAEDAAKVAQRVVEVLEPPFNFEDREFHVTTSIGIALYPSDGEDAQTLLKNADIALYRAKEQGRNNYQLYTPILNAKAFERLAIENSLRRALEREEFVIYYHPQVDLNSQKVVGMEALLRWQHPDRGLISPSDFIPIAEETGLIIPIGEWVLRTACEQNKAWRDAGYSPIRVAVNLSARQFQQRRLVETIEQILKGTLLESNYLELEITESTIMKDTDAAITTLHRLKEMGIKVSIDDFGTGYSSLSNLKRFPIDTLKIDRSFVRDITVDPDDAAIATAIITLAHSLHLKVVAEGVETFEQMELLHSLECDEMQGYIFSHPLPVEEATELLAGAGRLHARWKLVLALAGREV